MNEMDRRGFLSRAAVGTLGLWVGGAGRSEATQGEGSPEPQKDATVGNGRRAVPGAETVRDRLWLWGHAAGSHTRSPEQYGLTRPSHVTPAEAAAYMGLRNVLMVRHGADLLPPTPECARTVAAMDRVVWSIEGGGGEDVDGVLKLREVLPNLRGVIMDDYFGRVTPPGPKMWLAENHVVFPVTLTLTFLEPVAPDRMELVQSGWRTRDYLSRDFAIDVSADGTDWKEVATGTLPPTALASVQVNLPGVSLKSLRVRILSTHDTAAAMSCGLTRVRLWAGERELPNEGIKAEASSSYPGHPAENVLSGDVENEDGPFSLAALRRLRQRLDAAEPRLDLWVVLYTGEFSQEPLLRPHLELCDVVTMWTWTANELAHLEGNFARFTGIVGDKRKVLGLYMWDYGAKKPMPRPAMERQCELGLRWLREGKIEGMIFLASCICDLNLEAVEWTRRWIADRGDEQI